MHRRPSLLLGSLAIAVGSVAVGPSVARPATTPTSTIADQLATVTTLTGPSETRFGEPAVFTATVTTVTGDPVAVDGDTVTFRARTTELGTSPVDSDGIATIDASALSAGQYPITAEYNGSSGFQPSTSNEVTFTVRRWSTTIELTAEPSEPNVGQAVTFTATVSSAGGTPDGEVVFSEGTTVLGERSVGEAFVLAFTSAGPHTITATYSGSGGFEASSAVSVTVTVVDPTPTTTTTTTTTSSTTPSLEATTTTLDVEPNTPFSFDPFTMTAEVTTQGSGEPVPGGTVTFTISVSGFGVVASETVAVSEGVAVWALSRLILGAGGATAAAVYNPAAGHRTSEASVPFTVLPPRTVTALSTSDNPSQPRDTVTVLAAVTVAVDRAPVPSGVVTFLVGPQGEQQELGTAAVSGGAATFEFSPPGPGQYLLWALYDGDAFSDSSATATHEVLGRQTVTVLSSSQNPSPFGSDVTFTARVFQNGTVPDGEVVFSVDGTEVATRELDDAGRATLSTADLASPLIPGSRVVTAAYQGTSMFAPSSFAITQQVDGATATVLEVSPSSSLEGHPVTFTASVVVAGTDIPVPGGGVEFFLDGASFDAVAVTAGTAVYTTRSIVAGSHEVTATYIPHVGNPQPPGFEGSTSDGVSLVVSETGPIDVELTSSKNPSAVGEEVTFTARATYPMHPGVAPLGRIDFIVDGSTAEGDVELDSDGIARYTTSALAEGQHTIVAEGGFAGVDVSDELTQRVGAPSTSSTTPDDSTPPGTSTPSSSTTAPPPPPTSTAPAPTTEPSSTSTTTPSSTSTSTPAGMQATTTRITSSANPSGIGEPVTFTVEVVSGDGSGPIGFRRAAAAPPPQGGSVTITDGADVLAVVELEDGRASYTTASLAAGTHMITATFSGTTTAAPSSATIVQRVEPVGELPSTR